MYEEKTHKPMSGWPIIPIQILSLVGSIYMTIFVSEFWFWLIILAALLVLFLSFGYQAVAPNDARVLLLFGKYIGSIRDSGFFFVFPFYTKTKITLRVRNFETGYGTPSKVNDRNGNPIEISAVVVWKVVNTAAATFEVENYDNFVSVQSEAALRNLASRHPYDAPDEETSLRGDAQEVSQQLMIDIQDRLGKAGVEILEARLSHLAYASEIAAAMLQRQQAQAVVDARTTIVEGAISMVEMALGRLQTQNIVDLDDSQRAAMVSNLLVVLCGSSTPQPVLNTTQS